MESHSLLSWVCSVSDRFMFFPCLVANVRFPSLDWTYDISYTAMALHQIAGWMETSLLKLHLFPCKYFWHLSSVWRLLSPLNWFRDQNLPALDFMSDLESVHLAVSPEILRMLQALDGSNYKQMFALTIPFEVCFQWPGQHWLYCKGGPQVFASKTDLTDWFYM